LCGICSARDKRDLVKEREFDPEGSYFELTDPRRAFSGETVGQHSILHGRVKISEAIQDALNGQCPVNIPKPQSIQRP
jgi:hypothetical protein